ncbi:MAG TPA: hypothetical protein VK809_06950 [Bacteroidia bacterium]|jgi:hypothetical protein|nr:hypothetical protein [Bacteroidia bacterium]
MIRKIILCFLLNPFLTFGQLPDTLNQVNTTGHKTGWWKSPIYWVHSGDTIANSTKLQYFQNGILIRALYYIDGELQESSFADKKKKIIIENFYEHKKMYTEIVALWKDTAINYPYDSDVGNIYQGLENEFSRSYFDTNVNYRCLTKKSYERWNDINKYSKWEPTYIAYYYKCGTFQYGELDFIMDENHNQNKSEKITSRIEGYSILDNYDIPAEVYRDFPWMPIQSDREE